MMLSDARTDYYKVSLRDVAIQGRTGITDRERTTQSLIFDVDAFVVMGENLHPKSIHDCLDYREIFDFITKEMARAPHVDLLETLLENLLDFCFKNQKITACRVCVRKPGIFDGQAIPSVEFFRTRQNHSSRN